MISQSAAACRLTARGTVRHGGDPRDGEQRPIHQTCRARGLGAAEAASHPPPPAPPNVPQLARLEGKILTSASDSRGSGTAAVCELPSQNRSDRLRPGEFRRRRKMAHRGHVPAKGGAKKTWPVDPAAAFHNGPTFKDYFELRDLVESRSDAFALGFTEALIEYALVGRVVLWMRSSRPTS